MVIPTPTFFNAACMTVTARTPQRRPRKAQNMPDNFKFSHSPAYRVFRPARSSSLKTKPADSTAPAQFTPNPIQSFQNIQAMWMLRLL